MQRELFSIEPAANGWMVVGEPGEPVTQATQFKAFECARRLARERFSATGVPTGVKVRLHCGDVVLADLHG